MFGTSLPKCMYRKNGSFYLVKKNRWLRLGSDLNAALTRYAELTSGVPRPYYKSVYWRARNNARNRALEFALSEAEFDEIVSRSNGMCEVTRIPFSVKNPSSSRRKPFAPSLDRIDCALPYSKDNCRLVAVCVNAALSDWGDDVFRTMVLAAQITSPA